MVNPSTGSEICGTFEEAVNPDQGQCFPYRVKRTCEVPALPVITCDDDEYETIESTPPNYFVVSARLFDENCLPITDEDGLAIQTIVA